MSKDKSAAVVAAETHLADMMRARSAVQSAMNTRRRIVITAALEADDEYNRLAEECREAQKSVERAMAERRVVVGSRSSNR